MLDAIERCLALSQRARGEQGEALALTLASLEAALAEARAAMAPSVDADDHAVLEPVSYTHLTLPTSDLV